MRESYAAWSDGDLDRMILNYHADIVMEDGEELPDTARHVGFTQVVNRVEELMQAVGESTYEIERLAVAGDRVATTARLFGPGKPGHPSFSMRLGQVATVREGRIVRIQVYNDPIAPFREIGIE